ncbi:glyceraldehyde-3-phosphate dehydrogenase [Alkalicoccus urumqiensis]|uniref:Glyceraldehyde-3-phosphate dehydrogenase n=1 Tax=Alkalicoccus urumqiensis TaxID=1548213 RepID=A0A2P6MDE6_ALKUR|nr:glyceraldehyde-3-phosphate dehydrogenase [Alkalicoccus urumqiensis]PRO64308.1 type I glyceraldehyde-3-phosphate dehydrogenase [Alkalicoccus urumqiensis]
MVRIAINGFGRIGRMVFRRALLDQHVEIAAVNASYPAETLAHLINYDSVHGPFEQKVYAEGDTLYAAGTEIPIVHSRIPEELPWGELNVDIVIEATGKFRERSEAARHLHAGAKKVIITAPGKNEDKTIVIGVNEDEYDASQHHVISNASCTTNCLAPVVRVLDHAFGIESGMMTTVHSYTGDQNNMDNPHKDLRRARGCAQSIIPTTTGAAKAISQVIPEMEGKLHGLALRVPTPNVSLVDLVIDVSRETSAEEVNALLKEASEGSMNRVLGYSEDPLVSIDYNGDSRSAVIDGLSTMVINDRQVKVLAWYDNEWGYSCRLVDLVHCVGRGLEAERETYAS